MFHLDPAYIGHAWPTFMWTVLIFAAIGCFMGFFEFVWFMSVGYGFAVMCIGLFHLIFGLINGSLTIATGILSVLFIIYGWRLGGYLLRRELKNANYKKTLESTGAAKRTPIFVSAVMWIIMMFLYTAQTSAVTYRVINQSADNVWAWIGIVITLPELLLRDPLLDRRRGLRHRLRHRQTVDRRSHRAGHHHLRHVQLGPASGAPPGEELRPRPRVPEVLRHRAHPLPLHEAVPHDESLQRLTPTPR